MLFTLKHNQKHASSHASASASTWIASLRRSRAFACRIQLALAAETKNRVFDSYSHRRLPVTFRRRFAEVEANVQCIHDVTYHVHDYRNHILTFVDFRRTYAGIQQPLCQRRRWTLKAVSIFDETLNGCRQRWRVEMIRALAVIRAKFSKGVINLSSRRPANIILSSGFVFARSDIWRLPAAA